VVLASACNSDTHIVVTASRDRCVGTWRSVSDPEETMKILDTAFGHPRGVLGRLGGMIMARWSAERNAWTIQQLAIRPDRRCLDVGCGPGALLHALAEHAQGGLLVGIDTSPVMLNQATRHNAQLIQRGRVQLQRASAVALPFADATIDIVLSANSVQLWPDQLAGVTEMRRVRKPGCQLAIILSRCGSRRMTRSKCSTISCRNCLQPLVSVRRAVRSRR
jgi:ubiquinone/menaquinone biosynthesis C-methylase UbiE